MELIDQIILFDKLNWTKLIELIDYIMLFEVDVFYLSGRLLTPMFCLHILSLTYENNASS